MRSWYLAVLCLALYLGLEWLVFEPAFLFHGDHERDLRYATLWVQHGVWPDSTPSISPLPFELGPLLYVFLAPIVAVSPDPFWVRTCLLLLVALGAALFYRLLGRRLGWAAAGLALLGFLSSTFCYELSRQLWHSSLLPLPLAGFFWATTRLMESEEGAIRYGVIAAVLAGVMVQLHLTAVTFVAVLLGVAFLRRSTLKWQGFLGGTVAFFVALFPFLFTLIASIRQGALNRLSSGGGPPWSPANPWEVLSFFSENVHTIWGDHIGPLFTGGFLLLVVLGSYAALRRSDPLARLLFATLCVGFVVESLLLGNQRAHRYMHANLMAAFGLTAFGAEWLLTRAPRLWRPQWLVAGLACLFGIEAFFSPVPHAEADGWLNAEEQRAVAGVLSENLPLPLDSMEQRVHGAFFGEAMGMGHMMSLFPEAETPFSETQHVMVMPSDLGLAPHGQPVGPAWTVKGGDRDVVVYAYEPFIEYAHLRLDEALQHRWRRRRSAQKGPGVRTFELAVPVTAPGVVHVVWSDGRSDRDRCDLQATVDGEPISAVARVMPGYEGLRAAALSVPRNGTVRVQLGPCRQLTFVDIW